MITDTEIKLKGLQVLTEFLGEVEAERFIAFSICYRGPTPVTESQKTPNRS